MYSTFELANPVHLVPLLFGVVLLLKKAAEMERYHNLRVIVLTAILSWIVICFFVAYGLTLGNPIEPYDCVDEQHFCMTEM
jgi:dolichyl-phosphate-mannose--protein O-mannosyl transferase